MVAKKGKTKAKPKNKKGSIADKINWGGKNKKKKK